MVEVWVRWGIGSAVHRCGIAGIVLESFGGRVVLLGGDGYVQAGWLYV